jgi:arylsulfatase A
MNRNSLIILGASHILIICLVGLFCGEVTGKPNIVLIMADDLGYGDISLHGAPDIRTPHIDGLAESGVYFSRFYTSGTVCSPTRAGLMTGRYQQRTGCDRVVYVEEKDLGMSLKEKLLPEYLKELGYVTGITGKWHLGYPAEYNPTRRGFDEFFGFLAGNIDYYTHYDRLDVYDLWRNEETVEVPGYMTELITDEAVSFINRHQDESFFLYVPYSAPHTPIQGPGEESRSEYPDGSKRYSGTPTRETFAAMVESMDTGIGVINQALKDHNLYDNTLLVFLSDNGADRNGRNAPYHFGKQLLYEGGIRTPMMLQWPDRIQAGAMIDVPGISLDLFSTILRAAGGTVPDDRVIDGKDVMPLIDGTTTQHHEYLYWEYAGGKAIQQGKWKYHVDRRGTERLTDLTVDIGETGNAIQDHPELAAQLKAKWDAWYEDVMRSGADRRMPDRKLTPKQIQQLPK